MRRGTPQRAAAMLLVCFGLPAQVCAEPARALAPAPSVVAQAATATQSAPASAPSDADLTQLAAQIQSKQPAARLAAAQAIASADSDSSEAETRYATWLRKELTAETPVFRLLIHSIWGQYPNPDYPRGPGKDPPMWLTRPEPPIPPKTPKNQRPKPHDPEAVDWLSALALLDVSKEPLLSSVPPNEAHRARGELLLKVALLRVLSLAGQRGSREAVHPVFEQAFVRDGLLRDECGRNVRAMGSAAIPGLIRIYNNKSRANYKMRRYASYQLDRMDRLRPSKAIAAASDDRVRADIIHAYGEVLAIDAVDAILEQVAARSRRVRREARWAWLRYVDGPPPPPAPKRKRKLPGGKEESEEKEDYLNHRELATLALRRLHKTLFGEDPSEKLSAKELTDTLFAHYDKQEEALYAKLFASGEAHLSAGQPQQAVEEFGWILANQPDHPRRAEMAAAFRRYGEQVSAEADHKNDDGLRSQAVGWLRHAVLLSPDQPDAGKLRARIHLLDGQLALSRGGDGKADFEQALAADPDSSEARLYLSRTAIKPQKRVSWLRWLSLGLLAAGLLLLGLWRRQTASIK
ncbi:MAG: hypothetical protein JNM40_07315 [Myxococcales bacterium]|nr:hypothetical protein [Myxococcales bacterium]